MENENLEKGMEDDPGSDVSKEEMSMTVSRLGYCLI